MGVDICIICNRDLPCRVGSCGTVDGARDEFRDFRDFDARATSAIETGDVFLFLELVDPSGRWPSMPS